MHVWPIGITPSRLLIAQWSVLHTHRALRLGIPESLLVNRLRWRRGCPITWVPWIRVPMLPPLWSAEGIKPLELVWPAEYEVVHDEDVIYVVDEMAAEPLPPPGSIIDMVM